MAQQTAAVLKTYFQTGDVPTQSQYEDLIDSFPNLSDNNTLEGIDTAVLPVTGGNQTTGYQITAALNLIATNPTASAVAVLPLALAGSTAFVVNNATLPALIYPQTGEIIGAAAANAPINITLKDILIFTCLVDGVWLLERENYGTEFAELTGTDLDITDVTPSVQATAYQLTAGYNNIGTAHSTTGSCKLPSAIAGRTVFISNNGGYTSNIWVPAGSVFLHSGTSTYVPLLDKMNAIFVCLKDGFWSYIPGQSVNSTTNYKEYVALLTQVTTGAPTATVLSNTLGTIVWGYGATGNYTGALTGAFTTNTVFMIAQNNFYNIACAYRNTDDSMIIETGNYVDDGVDGVLSSSLIIIRQYY